MAAEARAQYDAPPVGHGFLAGEEYDLVGAFLVFLVVSLPSNVLNIVRDWLIPSNSSGDAHFQAIGNHSALFYGTGRSACVPGASFLSWTFGFMGLCFRVWILYKIYQFISPFLRRSIVGSEAALRRESLRILEKAKPVFAITWPILPSLACTVVVLGELVLLTAYLLAAQLLRGIKNAKCHVLRQLGRVHRTEEAGGRPQCRTCSSASRGWYSPTKCMEPAALCRGIKDQLQRAEHKLALTEEEISNHEAHSGELRFQIDIANEHTEFAYRIFEAAVKS